MSTAAASPVTVTHIPDPAEPVPAIAWPTVALLIAGLALWLGFAALGFAGAAPAVLCVAVVAIASYLLFTVSHDAAHHAASANERVNRWIGRIATPFFAPQASFAVWRFIHMQHHRFTNHDDGSDPDGYTMGGPTWQRPIRWATIDLAYIGFYLRRLRSRPRAEKREYAIQLALVLALAGVVVATGHTTDLLLFVLLPQRLSIVWLAFAFDYLPHHGLHHRPAEDKLKTTRNRVGGERWLSPLLLYQNYHLVHHLHPLVPFYRYLAVWRRNENDYLAGDPALSTVRGRALTADEYRQLRRLAEH
ncbi:MAG TPA: fatty acid desaturase [Solirubrobacteraceae bacterium]